jgi:hypothetical protein
VDFGIGTASGVRDRISRRKGLIPRQRQRSVALFERTSLTIHESIYPKDANPSASSQDSQRVVHTFSSADTLR